MKTRIVSAVVGITIFLAALFAPYYVFDALTVVLAAIGTFEFLRTTGLLNKKPLAATGIFAPIMCGILGMAHKLGSVVLYEVCALIAALYIGVIFLVMTVCHKEVKTTDASVAFFGTSFIALLYSYIFALRASEYGIYLIILLFAATWCADGGAYFVGVLFGKHKLAPELSPKKTIEGAVGGIVAAVLSMGIYAAILENIFNVPCNLPALLVTGLLCSILGPVGDIATSAIKREYNVKDYGNLIPGHGGVLDRFDSVLLTAPAVFLINEFFTLIG